MKDVSPLEIDLQLEWPAKYWFQPAGGEASKVILLLHGFQQTGESIFKRLSSLADEETCVLAPNALFPIPVKQKDHWYLAATWYFFDLAAQKYLLSMQPAVNYLARLLEKLKLTGLPLVTIGFSQGGYLAPFFAKEWSSCHQVIGIGSRFRSEILTGSYPFRIDAIHGAKDQIVSPETSKKCHEEIIADGNQGEFRLLPKLGHWIDESVVACCRELLR